MMLRALWGLQGSADHCDGRHRLLRIIGAVELAADCAI
jgi:hypothetical protein